MEKWLLLVLCGSCVYGVWCGLEGVVMVLCDVGLVCCVWYVVMWIN